ncbi:hypothetical protein E4U41_004803, partial [Claviceps citrina]
DVALGRRLARLRDEVSFVTRRQREAQEGYRRAREELDALREGEGRAAVNGMDR